jgi:hypothetical protein
MMPSWKKNSNHQSLFNSHQDPTKKATTDNPRLSARLGGFERERRNSDLVDHSPSLRRRSQVDRSELRGSFEQLEECRIEFCVCICLEEKRWGFE